MPDEAYGSWHNEAAQIIEAIEQRQQDQVNMVLLMEALTSLTEAVGALHKRVQDLETRQSPARYQYETPVQWEGTDNLPDGSGTWP